MLLFEEQTGVNAWNQVSFFKFSEGKCLEETVNWRPKGSSRSKSLGSCLAPVVSLSKSMAHSMYGTCYHHLWLTSAGSFTSAFKSLGLASGGAFISAGQHSSWRLAEQLSGISLCKGLPSA